MTPKERAVMQQALEALEKTGIEGTWLLHDEAITSLREALEHSGEANEMVDCCQEAYDALEAQLIKEPTGNGLDQVAQNNGLIIAMNTLQKINLAKQAEQEPWKCACGANLYIDSNGAPASKAEQVKQEDKDLVAQMNIDVGLRQKVYEALAKQAEQEPVAFVSEVYQSRYTLEWNGRSLPVGTLLYAAPVRTKDLTDQEIQNLRHKIDWTAEWSYVNFARAVIAAYKEKNRG